MPAVPGLRAVCPSTAALGLTGCLVLAGCLAEKEKETAGVDDFPNSIYARVQGNLQDAGQGESAVVPADAMRILQGPASVPQVSGTPKQGALNGPGALFKRLAGGAGETEGFMLDRFDRDTAWLYLAFSKSDAEKATEDTLFFAPGTRIFDSLSRTQGLAASKHVERFRTGKLSMAMFRDGDGDGLIASPVGRARVSVLFYQRLGDTVETADLNVDGGGDSNFDTEADNRIYRARWLKLYGRDTLASAAYADADGDSVVLDNAKPSLADLEYVERNPKDKPEVAERRLALRVIARYQQEPQEIRRFAAVERLRDGRRQTLSMRNDSGGYDLDPKGKITVTLSLSETPAEDSTERLDMVSVIKPEKAVGLDRDSLYSYAATATKRLGEERLAKFTFDCGPEGKPVQPKSEPRNGKVTLDIAYRDGTAVAVEGELKDGAFSALITARDGARYDVAWNAKGEIVHAHVTRP